jgi:hypothetical protein
MATLVINTSRVPQHVGVIEADNTLASVHIMGRGRVELAPDVKVDPNWMALYGKYIKTVEQDAIAVSQVSQSAVTVAQTPAKNSTAETVTESPAGDTK